MTPPTGFFHKRLRNGRQETGPNQANKPAVPVIQCEGQTRSQSDQNRLLREEARGEVRNDHATTRYGREEMRMEYFGWSQKAANS